jgi:hypothetical protein
MAGRANFQYAELPIMKYRVFDTESRTFNNVPIQPVSNFHWPSQEGEPPDLHDEQSNQETQNSDQTDEQPTVTEDAAEKVPEAIEIMADSDPSQGRSLTSPF